MVTEMLNTPDSEPISSSQASQAELQITGCIFDVKKYAIHDGPGIRTTVFFKGCPLNCQWCHNPESWKPSPELGLRKGRCIRCGRCVDVCITQAISLFEDHSVTDPTDCKLCGECVDVCLTGAREIIGYQTSVADVMAEIEKDIVFYDQSGGGTTFSGGEPLMQPQFLLALLNQCKERNIHTAVDTSCHAEPRIVDMISEKTDLFLCDLKTMDSSIHERFTGVPNTLILDNIKRLAQAGKDMIIRLPVVPGFNDDDANIEATAKFAASLTGVTTIDILPYNRGGKEKSDRLTSAIKLMQTDTPDPQEMNSIARSFNKYGLEVNIGG